MVRDISRLFLMNITNSNAFGLIVHIENKIANNLNYAEVEDNDDEF